MTIWPHEGQRLSIPWNPRAFSSAMVEVGLTESGLMGLMGGTVRN